MAFRLAVAVVAALTFTGVTATYSTAVDADEKKVTVAWYAAGW